MAIASTGIKPKTRSGEPATAGSLESFVVIGVDQYGNKVRQPVPAFDRASAVRAATELRIQVERVVTPDSVGVGARVAGALSEITFFRKLDECKMQFWTDVSESVRANETMTEAIEYATKNTLEPRFRSVLLAVLLDTQSTKVPVHEALAKHPTVFTAFEIDIVRLATSSQINVKDAVDRIVLDLERDRKYRLRRVGLELSPRATTAAAFLLFLLSGKLIPGVYEVPFKNHFPNPLSFGPWVTFASSIANVVFSWYGLLAIFLLLPTGIGAYFRLRREPRVKEIIENIRHSQNSVSRILFPMAALDRKRNIERMCSLYSLLLGTGKRTFVEATEVVARTVDSQLLRNALNEFVERMDSTKPSLVDAFALTEGVIDPVTIRRFRTAATKGSKEGGLAGMFAARAVALREELDLRDFERVVPRIQVSAAIPMMAGLIAVGLTVYEPILILFSNSRIR